MALLNRISIKWKLSLAILAAGLTLILAYVYMTNRIFRADKIAYVFDSQSTWLESVTSGVESKISGVFANARVVASTFDLESGRPSALGQQIFSEDKVLVAMELWNAETSASLLRLEKQSSVLPPLSTQERDQEIDAIYFYPINQKIGLLSLRFNPAGRETMNLRAVVDLMALFPKPSLNQSMALVQDGKVLYVSDLRDIDGAVFQALARQPAGASKSLTKIYRHGDWPFLVTEIKLSFGQLRLIGLTPEAEALGALTSLTQRLVLFLFFSIFALIMISLTLARGLTQNLGSLTRHAEEIGRGHFDETPTVQSEDEIGVLSRAFAKMSFEIKRLLSEMRDKTRMEEELKTAKLIQERLLPPQQAVTKGELEINGLVMTSSECGGDWWHYFEKGEDVYVAIADATGHGTPAALITAAARAIFSRLETENLSLKEMMVAWDAAVRSCSQRQVFMTGMLFRLNKQTGQGAFYNAGHDAPFVFRASKYGNFEWENLTGPASSQLGDGMDPSVEETPFQLHPNDCLVLYTDGLFAVTSQNGSTLSERRVGRAVAAKPEFHQSAETVTQAVLKVFEGHRQNTPMPDDVSLVVVRRKGPENLFLAGSDRQAS